MYDSHEVLASIDLNKWPILVLCALAMICNYAWFFAAVIRGFKDKVYPVPIFSTLFWLAGDSSVVMSYDLAFRVYNHWYLKLFWFALLVTVTCEPVYLFMIIKFGRKEVSPRLSQHQFTALMLAMLGGMLVGWHFLMRLLGDDLFINYFHLANFVGPFCAAFLLLRRGNRAGTSPFIWGAYTVMVTCWFTATALWFGAPFASPMFLTVYGVCIASAAAMTWAAARAPLPQPGAVA